MENSTQKSYVDLVTIAKLGSPIKIVMKNLRLLESIYLASTNQEIRDSAIKENRELKVINEMGSINMNLFSKPISVHEINIIHRTFPDLWKIRADLADTDDNFLDNLRRFKSLQKLSVIINEGDHNYNLNSLPLKILSCRAQFYYSTTDCIFTLLRQISNIKTFSLHKGSLSIRTITLLETRNIETLKIRNSIIRNGSYLVRMILNNKNLKYLKLTTDNYIISAYPIFVASDVINQLDEYKLNLTRLTFTLDQTMRIKYENLKHLKELRRLTIYYSVATNSINIGNIIKIVSSLKNVEATFIEYLETSKPLSNEIIKNYEEKSYYFKNVIESQDKYIEVSTIDYSTLRENRNLNFLN